jgi:heme-binding NEAT domain protein
MHIYTDNTKICAMQEELAQTHTAVNVSQEMQAQLQQENQDLIGAFQDYKRKSEEDMATVSVKNRSYKRQVVKYARQLEVLKEEVVSACV